MCGRTATSATSLLLGTHSRLPALGGARNLYLPRLSSWLSDKHGHYAGHTTRHAWGGTALINARELFPQKCRSCRTVAGPAAIAKASRPKDGSIPNVMVANAHGTVTGGGDGRPRLSPSAAAAAAAALMVVVGVTVVTVVPLEMVTVTLQRCRWNHVVAKSGGANVSKSNATLLPSSLNSLPRPAESGLGAGPQHVWRSAVLTDRHHRDCRTAEAAQDGTLGFPHTPGLVLYT